MLSVSFLVDTSASLNLVNKDFLLPASRKSRNTFKSPLLCTASRKVVSVEGTVPLFVRMRDIHVRAWFGIVDNLAIDVLHGTSLNKCCTQGTLSL